MNNEIPTWSEQLRIALKNRYELTGDDVVTEIDRYLEERNIKTSKFTRLYSNPLTYRQRVKQQGKS